MAVIDWWISAQLTEQPSIKPICCQSLWSRSIKIMHFLHNTCHQQQGWIFTCRYTIYELQVVKTPQKIKHLLTLTAADHRSKEFVRHQVDRVPFRDRDLPRAREWPRKSCWSCSSCSVEFGGANNNSLLVLWVSGVSQGCLEVIWNK